MGSPNTRMPLAEKQPMTGKRPQRNKANVAETLLADKYSGYLRGLLPLWHWCSNATPTLRYRVLITKHAPICVELLGLSVGVSGRSRRGDPIVEWTGFPGVHRSSSGEGVSKQGARYCMAPLYFEAEKSSWKTILLPRPISNGCTVRHDAYRTGRGNRSLCSGWGSGAGQTVRRKRTSPK